MNNENNYNATNDENGGLDAELASVSRALDRLGQVERDSAPAALEARMASTTMFALSASRASAAKHDRGGSRLWLRLAAAVALISAGAIAGGAAPGQIGLANGDTIHAINGFDLTSPDKALEVYNPTAGALELTFDFCGVQGTIGGLTVVSNLVFFPDASGGSRFLDASVRAVLLPTVARLSMDTGEAGRLNVQLKVQDGVTDIRAAGPAAATGAPPSPGAPPSGVKRSCQRG